MSKSRKDGHGRCGACGDAGECRRHRERAWHKVDDAEPIDTTPIEHHTEDCLCQSCLDEFRQAVA